MVSNPNDDTDTPSGHLRAAGDSLNDAHTELRRAQESADVREAERLISAKRDLVAALEQTFYELATLYEAKSRVEENDAE